MKYSMPKRTKKKKKVVIVMSTVAFVLLLSIGGWLGYHGWDMQRSIAAMGIGEIEKNKTADAEMVPVGGDPTEKDEVPVETPSEEPAQTPVEDKTEEKP